MNRRMNTWIDIMVFRYTVWAHELIAAWLDGCLDGLIDDF